MTSLGSSSREFPPDLSESSGEYSLDESRTSTKSVSWSSEECQVRILEDYASTISPLPPIHTMALVAGLMLVFFKSLPSLASLDQVATLGTFTKTNFDSLPLSAVIAVRLLLATTMLGNAVHVFLYSKWKVDTEYSPNSELVHVPEIRFRGALRTGGTVWSGLKCISSFALWCWILEGVAFLLAGLIPLYHELFPGAPISPWVFRMALVCWETAAPVSILVSAVAKFALWPMSQSADNIRKRLRTRSALLQHNVNTIAALVELGMLGGLPVCLTHFAFLPLYGILYLLFSYAMMYSWTDRRHGPQYMYSFFDTTLGATTTVSLVGLLALLLASLVIFCGVGALLIEAPESRGAVPTAAIFLLSLGICRFQD